MTGWVRYLDGWALAALRPTRPDWACEAPGCQGLRATEHWCDLHEQIRAATQNSGGAN